MTDVEYTENALDQLSNLDPPVADRILRKVEEATEWTEHRLEPLSGYAYYKIRAGDWRAIVTWDREQDRIIVKAVAIDGPSTTVIYRRDPFEIDLMSGEYDGGVLRRGFDDESYGQSLSQPQNGTTNSGPGPPPVYPT